MIGQEASRRYAKALFLLATEKKQVEKALNQLRELTEAIDKSESLRDFFTGPTTKAADQKEVLAKLFEKNDLIEEVKGLLSVLTEKRRLNLLSEIVLAYQSVVDEANGVDRGVVRSAMTLGPDDRSKIESIISKHTGKKAVLDYQVDKSLLGGLVAQVGSFTFDDSLDTQLRLLPQAFRNRRVH